MSDDVKTGLFVFLGLTVLVGGIVFGGVTCNRQEMDFMGKCVSAGKAPLECAAAKDVRSR